MTAERGVGVWARETPEPTIIVAHYSQGTMVDALSFDEARCVSGFGQVLKALYRLHQNGVVPRDFKPSKFLVELRPYSKIDNTRLQTFCGTLQYVAPEMFPGLSNGHGPPADV